MNYEGELPESYASRRRDKKAALKFLKKAMRKRGKREVIVTVRLRSYGAALEELGSGGR